MNIPEKYKYTKDHEWIIVDSNGDIICGITEFAQKELGDIVFVDIDTLGNFIEKEEVFGTVEAVKTVSDLFMPLAGTIKEFNTELEANPELINKDPYKNGWIIKITDYDESAINYLLSANEYKELLGL